MQKIQNDLPSLPKRIKNKKCQRLVCNSYDKCCKHKRPKANLGLQADTRKVHRIIKLS